MKHPYISRRQPDTEYLDFDGNLRRYANMPALSLREQYAKAAARLQTGWTP